jgi:NAD(P)-dependent dehydrogenase (short-subunit alcohol dehydrogenase family)
MPANETEVNMSKIALVTGANKGIGFETVRQLAKAGVHTILASRDGAKGAAAVQKLTAEGLEVEALTLDVNDAASIAAAAKTVSSKHGHLDILINNAGVGINDGAKKASEQKMETWRKTFDTNVFGLIAVTQAFLPLLEKSAAGRIVNLSSILGSLTLHSDPKSPIYGYAAAAYNVSKTAVNAYTVQLAYELRDSKIKVNAAHPGHVKTDMGGAAAPMELIDGAKTSVALALIGADGPNGAYIHMGQKLPW